MVLGFIGSISFSISFLPVTPTNAERKKNHFATLEKQQNQILGKQASEKNVAIACFAVFRSTSKKLYVCGATVKRYCFVDMAAAKVANPSRLMAFPSLVIAYTHSLSLFIIWMALWGALSPILQSSTRLAKVTH